MAKTKKKPVTSPKKSRRPKIEDKPSPLQDMLQTLENEWEVARRREPTQSPYEIGPGIYEDIPFETYCRIPAINQSSLAALRRSPAHYRQASSLSEEAPHFRFGTIFHEGHLQPELIAQKYVVVPEESFVEATQAWARNNPDIKGNTPQEKEYKTPKASKYYKDLVENYLAAHKGKQQVSLQWLTDIGNMLDRLMKNELAVALFEDGRPEVTIVWEDARTGLLCKGRIDWVSFSYNSLTDLKSTAEDGGDFYLDKWNYHVQGPFYIDGYRLARRALPPKQRKKWPEITDDFYFAVCEKRVPYQCRVAPIDSTALITGRYEYQFLLALLKHCQDAKHWPYLPNPTGWSISRYYRQLDFPSATYYEHLIDE